jgi:hypothetical protein
MLLGTIEAASENEAIEKALAKWKGKLLAVPASPPSVTRRPVTLILRKVAHKPEDIPHVAA